jgi:hypothetical protein
MRWLNAPRVERGEVASENYEARGEWRRQQQADGAPEPGPEQR